MKLLLLTVLAAFMLESCSRKDSSNDLDNKNRTLEVSISGYEGKWGVFLNFDKPVTIEGSLKVDFDVYYLGALQKHNSFKVPFKITDVSGGFVFKTNESGGLGTGIELRNKVVDSLVITKGDYNITLK